MINQKHLILLTLVFSLNINQEAHGQSVAQIIQYIEEVVARAGSFAYLNCTVASPNKDAQKNVHVEWMFLNATGGGKVISRNCKIEEDHNLQSGRKKYDAECVDIRSGVTRHALRINRLELPDHGTYQCRVLLSNVLKPTDNASVPLTVLSPPKVIVSSSSIVVDAFIGENVTLNCSARGTPAPNVTWGRANGRPLPEIRATLVRTNLSDTETQQALHLYNLTREDRGTYRCSADNNVRPPSDLFSRLSIEFEPVASAVEPSYGSPTGENIRVMIWCKVDGNPRPSLSWYQMTKVDAERYDQGLLQLDEQFFATKEAKLSDNKYRIEQKIMTVGSLSTMESMFYSLTILTVESDDMVYYVCRATNKHGSSAAAVELYLTSAFVSQGASTSASAPLTLSWVAVFISLVSTRFLS